MTEAYAYYRPSWPQRGGLDLRGQVLTDRGQAVLDKDGTAVIGGLFPDDYSRTVFFAKSWRDVAIEHLVPSRRLWDLLCEREDGKPDTVLWRQLYTAPVNLWVTDRMTNSRKGTKGPHEWCPQSKIARRRAAAAIRCLLYRWDLTTRPEWDRGLRAWEMGECVAGGES